MKKKFLVHMHFNFDSSSLDFEYFEIIVMARIKVSMKKRTAKHLIKVVTVGYFTRLWNCLLSVFRVILRVRILEFINYDINHNYYIIT